jgi:hypothetical protein
MTAIIPARPCMGIRKDGTSANAARKTMDQNARHLSQFIGFMFIILAL